jgi:hypothetical protein
MFDTQESLTESVEVFFTYKDVVQLIDNAIDEVKGTTIVASARMIDVLLDVRYAMVALESKDAETDQTDIVMG